MRACDCVVCFLSCHFVQNRDSRPTVDMTALMRENLIDHSPLQQGKRAPFPVPRPLTDGQSHSYSHFKPRQREDRIVSLFGPNSRHRADPHLPEVDAQAGKARLAQFLLAHFDRFWLYHDAWYSITLVLSRVYFFVPETRSLYLPVDFKTAELGTFLDCHLPALLHEATVNAKAKSKRTNAQAP